MSAVQVRARGSSRTDRKQRRLRGTEIPHAPSTPNCARARSTTKGTIWVSPSVVPHLRQLSKGAIIKTNNIKKGPEIRALACISFAVPASAGTSYIAARTHTHTLWPLFLRRETTGTSSQRTVSSQPIYSAENASRDRLFVIRHCTPRIIT